MRTTNIMRKKRTMIANNLFTTKAEQIGKELAITDTIPTPEVIRSVLHASYGDRLSRAERVGVVATTQRFAERKECAGKKEEK